MSSLYAALYALIEFAAKRVLKLKSLSDVDAYATVSLFLVLSRRNLRIGSIFTLSCFPTLCSIGINCINSQIYGSLSSEAVYSINFNLF